ncbi:hypothetical protein KP509_01G111700 [Ceratopteris richardii]|uniref:PH domain-containing protein n=1 Tax=Ceratopteris richardii TaxID=49495 RepID=A0A8T2VKD7_CERRI|nr:hypothetical protein KP509_01G111700 [Ceratopteris richardii]KAH7447558.1 hypothetical protein KP509_01G111700 [Ceratopteris richardii]
MHPLCCIAPVPLEGEGSSLTSPSRASSVAAQPQREGPRIVMAVESEVAEKHAKGPISTSRSLPPMYPSIPNHNHHLRKHSSTTLLESGSDQIIRRSPSHPSNERHKGSSASDTSFRTNHDLHDTKENSVAVKESTVTCVVGSNMAGILYKWVNFGKGWRPRWFVLQDGVLSYYKVHGPDKITVNPQEQKGFRVVGNESNRFLRKRRNINADESPEQKPFGEFHLQVCSIRKSKSDEKRFYIITGTKTLHVRAETRDDRTLWFDSLQSAKDMFPRAPFAHDLTLPIKEITISTTKLRDRLIQEGVDNHVIEDCEDIVMTEFREFQSHLMTLQQNHINLIERLRLVEAEKVELETTVVDQQGDNLRESHHEVEYEGSVSDTDEDIVKPDGVDGETDEDDDTYFDTKEFLTFRKHNSVDSLGSASDSDDMSPKAAGAGDPSMELVGFKYPYVKRRKRLPDPKEKEKGVSLWSLIKDNIGKDLTRVCLPVYFNEPISSLQKCFEDLEYSYLLDRAYEWGRRGNPLMRLLHVAAFAVSGYSSTEDRNCKPFNPLLGETYEADFPDKGLRFFSEKVSHHPMIVACHCDGKGWRFWGDSNVKSKFWGRSIQLDPVGILTLEFEDGETYQWSKVTTSIYNLIIGKLYCDHYGTMRIQGNRELSCRLKFKEQSIIDRNPHQVQGFVHDKTGQKLASLFGKWDESMYYVPGDLAAKPKGYDPMTEAELLWERNKPSVFSTRYNLTSFAITLNELTPGLKELLPPTDSRLRPDQRHLENGEYDRAFQEKLRLEEKQRVARKLQERGWQPRWFHKPKGKDTYQYIGGYWEARSTGNWSSCPDIFGPWLPDLTQ